MTCRHRYTVAYGIAVLATLALGVSLRAQVEIGTWVKQATPGSPAGLTLVVEACCNGGRRLTYKLTGQNLTMMTIETKLDGSESPVIANGKPSGETMAIKRVDARRVDCIIKMNGVLFATSKGTLSADGKTLTVENIVAKPVAGQPALQTEIWVRQ